MLVSWSIERKLTLIIVTATAVAILAASTLLITQHARTSRAQLLDDLQTLAEIVGDNSQAALSFADAGDATEVLGALRGKESIRLAVLYLANGHILAQYRASGQLGLPTPASPGPDGVEWGAHEVRLFHSILRNNEVLGSLHMNADLGPWRRNIASHVAWAVVIALASLVLASLLATGLQHRVLSRINNVVAMADAVAAGDLPERMPITSGDEVGVLQRSFNQIVDTERDIVRQAQALARGDYSITIRPRSDKDELGLALIQMTQELRRYYEQSERLNWLKTALSDLNDRMRGEQSMDSLTGKILQSLAAQSGSWIGAIYLSDKDGHLRRGSGYAVENNALPAEFAPGQGLVGQVAINREIMLVQLPDDALSVHTATSGARVRQVALVPLVREKELMGVLELGTADHFTPEHRELFQMAAASIAIALHVARAREQLNELLVQTQHQSETLREQQDALQKSNADLGERNALLEHQKQEIHRQNEALEGARLDLERKARELAQASQYKSEFLANVSHELRTPLNSLLILSRLLADNRDGNLTPKQVEFSQTIHKSGSDLLTLINDILDLSKVEAGRMEFTVESTPVRDVCASVESIFRPLAEQKGLSFEVRLEAEVPARVQTDAHRVGQILRNLMSNAFKFTSKGGVTLRVYRPDVPGRAVAFAVHDTGIGIPPEKQEMVFAAFQQADGATSREYGGTGLGLTISRELARRLGGDLTLESAPGQGSTFTLWLPNAASTVALNSAPPIPAFVPPPVASPIPARPGDDRSALGPGVQCMLVIDDDPLFASIVRDFVRSRNLPCLLAATGEEGLELARRHRPLGIVMDVMLPGLDGHAVLRRLKADVQTRTIPVFVISALDRDQQMMRDGAVGVLSKPVSAEELGRALERLQSVAEHRTRRVLVVEDQEEDAHSLIQLLKSSSMEVVAVDRGSTALERLQKEPFDAVVLDLGLSDMSDQHMIEGVAKIRGDHYLPVIVHTGRELSRDEESMLRRDVASIVIKGPQAPEQLLDRLRLFLHLPVETGPISRNVRPVNPASMAVRGTLKGQRVLVVDDDMRNAFSLAAVLDREGMICDLAADGDKALAKLQAGPGYAAVLMDVMMPGRDGYDTIRAIRTQPPFRRLPIVALTAKAMVGDREKCLEAGATDYLPKPLEVDRLLDVLERVLGVAT